MSSLLNVCRFTPAAGGITDWAYSSAVTGYQSPAAAGVVNGATYSYRAESSDLSQWEVGTGAYNTGTNVLSRTAVLFNSLGTTNKINFSAAPQVAIVALAEDLANTVANGKTGVTNLVGTTTGLQPLKLSTGVIGVNPGTWSNNTGNALYNTTSVLTADLTTASINFGVTPAVGGQVSGALSTGGTSTDFTEVFLYLVHRNSDGKVALIGSSSDTQGASTTFTATATTPGVITTAVAHGLRKRMAVYVSNSGGALPSPLGAGVQYYVATVPSSTTFTLATSIANVNSGTNLPFTTTGSGTNTVKWGVQNDIDFQLGAGVVTFDRRMPFFAFVWRNDWGSIPNFTTAQGSYRTLLTSQDETTKYGYSGQTPGSSYVAKDFSPWLANINRQVLLKIVSTGGASGGSTFARTTSSGGSNTIAVVPAGQTQVDFIELATDSVSQVDISTTGTATMGVYVHGWTQMDPS